MDKFKVNEARELTLEEAFPTATIEQLADLYLGPIDRIPMRVTKVDNKNKTITFDTDGRHRRTNTR